MDNPFVHIDDKYGLTLRHFPLSVITDHCIFEYTVSGRRCFLSLLFPLETLGDTVLGTVTSTTKFIVMGSHNIIQQETQIMLFLK